MSLVNQSGFIVRKSGVAEDKYYIDYQGSYKTTDIAKITGLKLAAVNETYTANGAVHDESLDVYYFPCMDAAKKTVAEIFGNVRSGLKGRMVNLTEAEVEYIRKALINEGSNTIHLKNKIKDEIFKKLNG